MIKLMKIILILSWLIINPFSAHAQTDDLTYTKYELSEIGVSFEAPVDWLVSFNGSAWGGRHLTLNLIFIAI